MGLSKKTFLYSILLAAVMVVFITVYFVFMLPPLYVDYVTDSNLDSVVRIQKGYMDNRSYDGLRVKNPSSVFSLEIPREGEKLYAAGKFFKMTVTVKDKDLQEILQILRGKAGNMRELKESPDLQQLRKLWERIKERFAGQRLFAEDYPVHIQMENKQSREAYQGEYDKIHQIADDLFVYEMGVSDGDYEYTTYFAFGQTKDAFIFTILPAMTPQMEEIKPVVMGSIPMIVAVVFLLVFIASRLFSRKIVQPVIRLAGYAERAKGADCFESDLFYTESKDEIGELSRILQELYERLQENYQELERKNAVLAEENERQEVFLRASSHQLKTPVAAAMLLVEGMMGEVGKYKDTKKYLPEVKQQLLSMQHIVQDILYLNNRAENMDAEQVDLRKLAEELLRGYQVQTEQRGLDITVSGSGCIITDREMILKICDNLLSNAVQYTPEGEKIYLEIDRDCLVITNYGVTIEESLLPGIFEPFVSSVENQKGKGLGLYVAAYYSRVLGYQLQVYNEKDRVCARLSWEKKGGRELC